MLILGWLLTVVTCFGISISAEENTDTNIDIKIEVIWKPKECIRKVEPKDFVRYHYYGMLTNGHQFDSSFEKEGTYDTYVGTGWLIPGMDKGLMGMCVNEHRLITIPPELAYGKEGTEDSVPPNATLIFNTIVLDVWNDDDITKYTRDFVPDGCPRQIKASDYVRYHYNGSLLSGKKFHSSHDEESTYNTYVGQGWVIKGMDEGLLGACRGERRTIVIPPHMAYGTKGDGKNIPRSATLVFEIEIVDFHNPDDTAEIVVIKEVENCERKLIDSDFVRYHYNGTLADGTVFDTSYQRNRTYDTYVGFKRVISGMEIGLQGACMGEWRSITIPPHLGYGEKGVGDKVPPSAVMIFHVHVIDFHNPKDTVVSKITELPLECNDPETRKADKDDYVTFNYVMRLVDGTVLDSSDTGDFGSYMGRQTLLPGVEMGLIGMCVGEKREVVIPPHIGYGEKGRASMGVPGSAVLIFTFNLLKIEDSLPDGFQFVWTHDPPSTEEEIFVVIDEDKDNSITLPEFTSYVLDQVERGHARLEPGRPREEVATDLFKFQDKNNDQQLTAREFQLLFERDLFGSKAGDEL